jgi:alkanesulfonate monooxygenase SsuD/methylene tetrahydromethanopterin reductase-like flavin-dependent oxidoreductase (luciferase family)
MRLSLSITNYSWPNPPPLAAELTRVVRCAEDVGLDTVWVTDHLLQADPTSTPDADEASFQAKAEEAKTTCIVSRALAGVEEITLSATLRA